MGQSCGGRITLKIAVLLTALPGMALAAPFLDRDLRKGLSGPTDAAIYRGTAEQFAFLEQQVVGGGPIPMVNMARFRPDDWRYRNFLDVFERVENPDDALLNAAYDDDPQTRLYRVVGNAGHDVFRPFVWLYISAPAPARVSPAAAPVAVPLPAPWSGMVFGLAGAVLVRMGRRKHSRE